MHSFGFIRTTKDKFNIYKRWKREEWKRKSKEAETENIQLQWHAPEAETVIQDQSQNEEIKADEPQNNKNKETYSISDEGKNMMILERKGNLPMTVR